jgi:putative ABC transport system permease protein
MAEMFGGVIPEEVAARIAAIPGVTAVAGELVSLAATDRNDQVIAAGWADNSFFWREVPLQQGRIPHEGERKVALLGNEIARAMQKRVGDEITLLGEQFRVIGITRYASIINRNAVLVPLADLQEAMFRSGVVTFLYARLARPDDPAEVARISQAIEETGPVTAAPSDEMLRNDRLVGLLRAVSSSMAWVALLMGILMVFNTLLMAVLERTREIGILSAVGWSPARVMGALVMEGLIYSAVGSAVGTVLGVIGSHLLSSVPAIGRYIAVRPTPDLIAATVLVTIALGILGSWYPAWLATRRDPASALARA